MEEEQPIRLRMLGAALRRYRLERGFSLDDAAAMLGCDRSKISRIETGTRGIRSHDLRDLLAEYGVSDGSVRVLRPHLFAASDRASLSGRSLFVSSDRTWAVSGRRPLTSADAPPLLGANGPGPVSAVTFGKHLTRLQGRNRGPNWRTTAVQTHERSQSDSERVGLVALVGPRGTGDWREEYADVLPRAAREYLWLEAAASKVFVYEGQRVPALLRAEGYARAIAEHDPLVPAGTEGKVTDAMAARQRAVLGAEQPELVMVIGEAALRQQVGGSRVMRAQLDRLAALSADSDRVAILVLPFASGAHAGAGSGPVTIFGFGQAPGLGAVHQAGLSGGIFLESPGDLDACAVAFTRLRASALSTEDSARLLCRMAGR